METKSFLACPTYHSPNAGYNLEQTGNNLKSTYVKNLGWYNANPTELARYPDSERGKRYVKAMGGEDAVLETALGFFDDGDYRFSIDILNNILYGHKYRSKFINGRRI